MAHGGGRAWLRPGWIALIPAAWFAALFADVLLGDVLPGILADRNFIYRDAGHFYYPYFKHIQQEWEAGHVPLWSTAENGGTPLAANPTASVFYPLKVLFFLLPFGKAFKWYHLAHVVIAFATCRWVARQWGQSQVAATFAALAYAGSAFVVFQVYNVVFLIGAAWLPLALWAAEQVADRGRHAILLAITLALQVLGGDPEIAYLVGVAALIHLIFRTLGARRGAWVVAGLVALGYAIVQSGKWRPILFGESSIGWGAAIESSPLSFLSIALALAFAAGVGWWFQPDWRLGGFGSRLAKLVAAGCLALALCAIQVLPTVNFTRRTDRAVPEAPHEPAAFSFFPLRIAEFALPNFFGRQLPINSRWFPFERIETGVWVPSSYIGILVVVFAAVAIPTWRECVPVRYLVILSAMMLWMSFGKFGGPLWLLDPNLGKRPDPLHATAGLSGTSDGLYRLAEEVVPGFHSFRYPSKLIVFPTLGMALLAGFGLDRIARIDQGRLGRVMAGLSGLLALAALAIFLSRSAWITWIPRFANVSTIFGPMVPESAWRDFWHSLAQPAAILAAFAVASWRLAGRAKALMVVATSLLAVDLLSANRWMILSDLQSVIDREPALVAKIKEDFAKHGDGQPYRVHRTRIFHPLRWNRSSTPDRMVEVSRWERDTFQPKYAIPFGIQYTTVTGTMSLYDSEFFFAPWVVETPASIRQSLPGAPAEMVYFPRTAYNMWNSRYFLLPKYIRLDDEDRGVYTLLGTRHGPPGEILAESPADADDYLVLKNPEAFPRAWVVHQADFRRPIRGFRRADRLHPMRELMYRSMDGGLLVWKEELPEYPLRQKVMIETESPTEWARFSTGEPVQPSEAPRFVSYESNHLEVEVEMAAAGFVVLAETFYPGWTAKVDEVPAEILLANRGMRSVAVSAGRHRITMHYRDRWFEFGAGMTALAWAVLLAWATWSFVPRRHIEPARQEPSVHAPQ